MYIYIYIERERYCSEFIVHVRRTVMLFMYVVVIFMFVVLFYVPEFSGATLIETQTHKYLVSTITHKLCLTMNHDVH